MPPRDRTDRRRPLAHRVSAGIALVAYGAAAFGCPLPTAFPKTHSQPFPCQQHACGCQSAEGCWARCCCFSAEEKLAWARTQRVDPPDYAERPAELGWRTVRERDREKAPAACGQACCQKKLAGSSPRMTGSKLGLNCSHCRGHSTLWITSGTVLPPPVISWRPFWVTEQRLIDHDVVAPARPATPVDPPPRRLS